MKKQRIFLTAVMMLFAGFAFAQFTDQGNFIIGSTIGFSTADSKISLESSTGMSVTENPASTQFNISPRIGYFLARDFALGIGLDYTLNSIREPNEDKRDDSNLLFGPFARYYFQMGNDIAFFGEANFGYGTSTDNQTIGEGRERISSNIFAIGAGPGITIISSSGVGLEAMFKYNYARSEFDTESGGVRTTTTTKTNQFDISLGITIYFEGLKRVGGG